MIINKFRRTMHDREMTNKAEIARITGLSRQTINDLWKDDFGGKTSIHFDTLNKLCRAFDLQITDIIQYVPDAGDDA